MSKISTFLKSFLIIFYFIFLLVVPLLLLLSYGCVLALLLLGLEMLSREQRPSRSLWPNLRQGLRGPRRRHPRQPRPHRVRGWRWRQLASRLAPSRSVSPASRVPAWEWDWGSYGGPNDAVLRHVAREGNRPPGVLAPKFIKVQ